MRPLSDLLRYSVNRTQYQYHIKNAALSAHQNFASQDARFSDAVLSIETEHPQIRQDSTAFFASIGLHKAGEMMADAAERGRQAALEATGRYSEMGRQMGQIDRGVTPAQVYCQRLDAQAHTSLVVRSAAPIDISYRPGGVQIDYTPAKVEIDWDVERALRRYTPAEFSLEVLQPPSITFTCLDDFQYIPERAAPGFNRLA